MSILKFSSHVITAMALGTLLAVVLHLAQQGMKTLGVPSELLAATIVVFVWAMVGGRRHARHFSLEVAKQAFTSAMLLLFVVPFMALVTDVDVGHSANKEWILKWCAIGCLSVSLLCSLWSLWLDHFKKSPAPPA